MGNERQRQLHGKLLKVKEELKFEREELKKVKPIHFTCKSSGTMRQGKKNESSPRQRKEFTNF